MIARSLTGALGGGSAVVTGEPAAEGHQVGSTPLLLAARGGPGRSGSATCACSEGARVVVNDIDAEPAQVVVDEIVAAGGEAVAAPGDVATGRRARR